MNKYTVYAITNKDNSNIVTQGYVGITSRPLEARLKHHATVITDVATGTTNLGVLIQNGTIDFNSLEINAVMSGLTKEQANELERALRPHNNIGWNVQKGGSFDNVATKLSVTNMITNEVEIFESQAKATRAKGFNKGGISTAAKNNGTIKGSDGIRYRIKKI